MKIKMLYDDRRQTLEVEADELVGWLNIDIESNLSEEILQKTIQEKIDKEFNRPEYNNWHKFDRHRGMPKRAYRRDDEEEDETDVMDTFGDNTQESERNNRYEYDALCQLIHNSLGLQFRYQNGEVQVNHNWFLGYTKDENGQLIIDPEQAEIVRRIYREYLQGASLKTIADGLTADGYLTAAGKTKWRADGIRKILTNEKYIGDALLQKTYTVDVLTKKRVANNGIVPQYYVENNHEAIIPRELFMQVQEELQRRANLRIGKGKTKRVYSSKYALSSIVYCGKCGDLYRRVAWKGRDMEYTNWRCATRIDTGGRNCDAETIHETELKNAVIRAINKTLGGREDMLIKLQQNIETVITKGNGETIAYIDKRLAGLQEELVKCVSGNKKYEMIADEIDALREKRQTLTNQEAEQSALKQRIEEMREFLQTQTSRVTEYDEQLVRRLIEKITVYSDRFEFVFKSGMSIDLKR